MKPISLNEIVNGSEIHISKGKDTKAKTRVSSVTFGTADMLADQCPSEIILPDMTILKSITVFQNKQDASRNDYVISLVVDEAIGELFERFEKLVREALGKQGSELYSTRVESDDYERNYRYLARHPKESDKGYRPTIPVKLQTIGVPPRFVAMLYDGNGVLQDPSVSSFVANMPAYCKARCIVQLSLHCVNDLVFPTLSLRSMRYTPQEPTIDVAAHTACLFDDIVLPPVPTGKWVEPEAERPAKKRKSNK